MKTNKKSSNTSTTKYCSNRQIQDQTIIDLKCFVVKPSQHIRDKTTTSH